ncbi:MAG: hypothetical protein ACTTKM_09100 [Prevotella fusca]|uniref:hypothetical protein n=1 Tax=Prevotella fusca TaxID=589436 RepID=UPI003F9F7882
MNLVYKEGREGDEEDEKKGRQRVDETLLLLFFDLYGGFYSLVGIQNISLTGGNFGLLFSVFLRIAGRFSRAPESSCLFI